MKISNIDRKRDLDDAFTIVSNGCVTPQEATRAIVINTKTQKPRRVYKVDRFGIASQQSSWQLCCFDDTIFVTKRSGRKAAIELQVFTLDSKGKMALVEESTIEELKATLNYAKYKDWLEDFGNGGKGKPSLLPAGIGWDGELSLYEKEKKGRLARILWCIPAAVREPLVQKGLRSAYTNLMLTWKSAEKFPRGINRDLDGLKISDPYPEAIVEWVLFREDGKNEHLQFCTQTHRWISSLEGSSINNTKGEHVKFPGNTARAVKIYINPYKVNRRDGGKGIAIKLYSRVDDDSTIGLKPFKGNPDKKTRKAKKVEKA